MIYSLSGNSPMCLWMGSQEDIPPTLPMDCLNKMGESSFLVKENPHVFHTRRDAFPWICWGISRTGRSRSTYPATKTSEPLDPGATCSISACRGTSSFSFIASSTTRSTSRDRRTSRTTGVARVIASIAGGFTSNEICSLDHQRHSPKMVQKGLHFF